METSDNPENVLYRVNNDLCAFSSCGEFFAIAYQSNLIIKKVGSFHTRNTYEFDDVIEYIEWSPNAQYVLCANARKTRVRVFSIHYPEWKFKLTEGSSGMERATWTPDSAHVVTFADFNIQVSVWSLENQSVTNIQNLKSSADSNVAFSPNGKTLAVITSEGGTDSIEIYKTRGWRISRKLLCDKLKAIDGVAWSANGELLCAWCSISGESKLLVYSMVSDSHVGVYCPEFSGGPLRSMENYHGPRGIEKVAWNPSGQLLAIAAFNEQIVILNYVTWRPLLELRCDPVISAKDYLGKVYRESTSGESKETRMTHQPQESQSKMEEVLERPINIPIASNYRVNPETPSIAGFDMLLYSACGRYLATRHQLYSSTIWIWDIAEDSVDHLLLKRPISSACWNPISARLTVFTESPRVYEWRASGESTSFTSPRGITVISGLWHPGGKILAVRGYNKTAIMRLGE